ncbi:MAG: dethiobiotin synthase [Alphaproteobacteria bacterium]
MSNTCIITGTDTDVGKTVVAAMLMLALGGTYWKPVQSGVAGGVDTKAVQKMTGLADERFLPERYVFTEALSPHRAAELDEARIDMGALEIPAAPGPLIIEGAGGLMVPLTRENLLINLFKKWNESAHVPVILVARTGLGTINHTLLSLEALWSRKIPVHGIVFVGDENEDNMQTIAGFSEIKVLGRLPMLDSLDAKSLSVAFEDNFNIEDF